MGRQINSADPWLIQKRIIKTPEDIAKIKKSITITETVYNYILENTIPGMYEYEVEAMIAYQFRLHQ